MLSEQQQQEISIQEPKFVEKLQRMETLSIKLGKLLGPNGKALGHINVDEKWFLTVDWSNFGRGSDEATYVTLRKRVKGWIRHKQVTVIQYYRHYDTDTCEESRSLSVFDDSVVAVLDKLSDELEEQIARASRATQEHKEQFRRVVEAHPREERSRFDQIEPLP